jgi:Spy/CpxP family protein refolding chaperone
MKKTAIVLTVGLIAIASATWIHAFGGHFGPPPCPPPHEELMDMEDGPAFDGPLGPPPGRPHHGPGMMGHGGFPPPLLEKLKLTDDQQKQMRSALVSFQDKSRKARSALMGLEDEKKTMMMSGKIDQSKLGKLDEDIVKLRSEVMSEALKMKREHLSTLTPEQLEVLASPPPPHRDVAHADKIMRR